MSSPPAKRQRTEDAPITRSDIWYPDGSVVFQPQNTQFRVHWGVLTEHSSFFRDMQGLPQPADQPSIDGCPIVELPDSAEDVKYLLKALYTPTFLAQKSIPLGAVGALIRLGRKYDFPELLASALERLTDENPSTLEDYDALKRNPRLFSPVKYQRVPRIVQYPGIIFDTLALARENKILSVLPCAYYRVLSLHSQVELFDGIPRGDGTSAHLGPVDQRQCVLAYRRLLMKQIKPGYTLGWVREWSADCTDSAKCNDARDEFFSRYLDTLPLSALSSKSAQPSRICFSCGMNINKLVSAGQKQIWEELPGFFDLPPWNELQNDA
ncbi:hypothetical protein C8R43DRAFT_1046095 [Mycena crocata]|nr:hypothetical protein C8R43DRAFT_1046095 [Mycena crocata]